MALNTTPAVPVHELHQFLLMKIQGQKKNRKIGALTYKSELQSYLSFCMASGQGVRLCIMGGYSLSEVCMPNLYYIMCPFRASPQGLTLCVMVINKIIGVFSLQQWLFRSTSAQKTRDLNFRASRVYLSKCVFGF